MSGWQRVFVINTMDQGYAIRKKDLHLRGIYPEQFKGEMLLKLIWTTAYG